METPWYHRWFGEEYLQLYRHRSPTEAANTVAWLVTVLEPSKQALILDLACGEGRHGIEFAHRGYRTVGLDLSWSLLQSSLTQASSDFQRIRGDMRWLPFRSGRFEVILSLFTSFGYFQDGSDDLQVLQEAQRILHPGGVFVLDYLNSPSVKERLVPEERTKIEGHSVHIQRSINTRQDRIEKRISLENAPGNFTSFQESVKLYTLPELKRIMRQTGFNPLETYGDYDGGEYSDHSPRLILIGQKSA